MSTTEGKIHREIPQDAVARNSFLIFGFQIVSKLLGFVAAVLLANYFGTTQFGVYSYAFALTSLFIPLCDLGMDIFLLRDIPRHDDDRAAKDFGSVLVSKTVLAVLVLSLITVVGGFLESWGTERFLYVVLAGGVTVLKAFWTSFSSVLRALNKVLTEAGLFIAARTGEFVVAVCSILTHQSIGVLIGAMLVINVIALIYSFIVVSRRYLRPQLKTTREQLRHIFREGIPYALTTIFTAIYFNFDTVLVSKLVNDRAAGLYRAVYNLILPMMMVTASVTGAVFPFVSQNFRRSPSDTHELVRRSARYLLLIGLPMAVFGCVEARDIVAFLFAPEYAESALSLSILVWFLPIVFLTNLFGNLLGAMDQQWYVLRITALNVVFNIVSNIVLIPMYAQNGASVVTVLTELLGFTFLITRMNNVVSSLIQFSFLVRVLLAMIPSLVFLYTLPHFNTPAVLVITAILYGGGIVVTRAVSLQEVRELSQYLRTMRREV